MSTPAFAQSVPALLDPGRARDRDLIDRLTDLVNRVYDEGEKGLWQPGVRRTTTAEMASLVARGETAAAYDGVAPVGHVRVHQLGPGLGGFGMLAAAPHLRGTGIGRGLVSFAEHWARTAGLSVMQLELLVPRGVTHPVKEFLRAWYTRIGYRPVRSTDIAVPHPELAPMLAVPCDFIVFHKALPPPARP